MPPFCRSACIVATVFAAVITRAVTSLQALRSRSKSLPGAAWRRVTPSKTSSPTSPLLPKPTCDVSLPTPPHRPATPNSTSPTRLQSSFNQNILNGQSVLLRTLTSTIAKSSALQAGDIFTFANPLATPGAFADYTEQGQPALKRWVSTGGTVTINSISAGTSNVTVSNLILTPAADGGNTASGTITANGTATLTF